MLQRSLRCNECQNDDRCWCNYICEYCGRAGIPSEVLTVASPTPTAVATEVGVVATPTVRTVVDAATVAQREADYQARFCRSKSG
jgi:hypothetical protein